MIDELTTYAVMIVIDAFALFVAGGSVVALIMSVAAIWREQR